MSSSLAIDYKEVLQAYKCASDVWTLEGDILSHSNGELIRINKLGIKYYDETLIPVLQKINAAAKRVFEAIEKDQISLSEEERKEFFKLRCLFASKMSNLEYRYRNINEPVRKIYNDSFQIHYQPNHKIISNDKINFNRYQNIVGTIPFKRDPNEDFNIIKTRISEANSYILPRARYIAKVVGKYLTFALLCIPVFLAELISNTALFVMKLFKMNKNVNSFDFIEWLDITTNKMFSGIRKHDMAKFALSSYVYQLAQEFTWDDEKFEVFESIVSYANTFVSNDMFKLISIISLELTEQDYVALDLSKDQIVIDTMKKIIQKLGGKISSVKAKLATEAITEDIQEARKTARNKSAFDKLQERITKKWIELFPNNNISSEHFIIMNPNQLIRYLEICKKHTNLRKIQFFDPLLRVNKEKPENTLFHKVIDMGFNIVPLLDLP